jgi:hypothetical protein
MNIHEIITAAFILGRTSEAASEDEHGDATKVA